MRTLGQRNVGDDSQSSQANKSLMRNRAVKNYTADDRMLAYVLRGVEEQLQSGDNHDLLTASSGG